MSLVAESNSGTISEQELDKVQLYSDLCLYEEALTKLVDSVDNFKPQLEIGKQLIEADKKLYSTLDLLPQYDSVCTRLRTLDDEISKVDQQTKNILSILNECHDDLNVLPLLEEVEFEKKMILKQREKIKSNVLLEYATKLAKFTKIPPTFDKGTIGPNNFIWPAEDALRKGMLAMASLHGKELTKLPGQEDGEEDGSTANEDKNIVKDAEGAEGEIRQDDKKEDDSFVFGANANDAEGDEDKNAGEDEDEAMDSDLDLFNPDEF